MANFIEDNEDLQFYLNRWIDWEQLYTLSELNPTDPAAPQSADEAREFWREILELIAEFSANEIAPHAAELDREAVSLKDGEVVFPPVLDGIFEQIGAMGLHGICLPRELGGMNCPLFLYMLQCELVSRADVSVMTHHGFHGGMATAMLMYSLEEGSTTFKPETFEITDTRFSGPISEILAGESWGCMDITEPDAGSDMGALRCVGEQDADGNWSVTGQKIFVTSGHGRYHFVIARTEEKGAGDFAGLSGLSFFLVETFTPNDDGSRVRHAQIERIEEKLGHHASATVTINFDQTPAMLVGERGEGFKQMLLLMNNARIGVGFEALGLCESAWRMSAEYAAVRQSMGKTIDQHELIADILDEMQSSVEGLRALCMRVAFLNETYQRKRLQLNFLVTEGSPEAAVLTEEVSRLKQQTRELTPLVKMAASETAVQLARMAVQVHGGSGYTTEYGAEKLLRDAMVLPIYEGTTQIQSLMATKDNLLSVTKNPARFARRLAKHWQRSLFADDGLERRVAGLRHQSLVAMRTLMSRVVKHKYGVAKANPEVTLSKAFKNWDAKSDFAPALLHAENLCWLLADAATAEELWQQASAHDERRAVLERFLERAEARGNDRMYRIQHTGDRLLAKLADDQNGTESAA
jgi:alkylation response protein AidB-like acyl-CoA dehydrogenase